jgi:hypothetical protein
MRTAPRRETGAVRFGNSAAIFYENYSRDIIRPLKAFMNQRHSDAGESATGTLFT